MASEEFLPEVQEGLELTERLPRPHSIGSVLLQSHVTCFPR